MKKKTKTTSKLRKEAWKAFSLWYRQSQADKDGWVQCYTCPAVMPWKNSHTGHAIGGRSNAVLLDEEICRIQCPRCNLKTRWGLAGNYPVFTTKLIAEHGLEWMEKKLAGSRQIVKFTRQDLLDKIEDYKKRL